MKAKCHRNPIKISITCRFVMPAYREPWIMEVDDIQADTLLRCAKALINLNSIVPCKYL